MTDNESLTTPDPKVTGFTPGDDIGTRWRNTFSLLMGRMNEQGKEQYLKARDDRYEESDCKWCEDKRDYMLKYSNYNISKTDGFELI